MGRKYQSLDVKLHITLLINKTTVSGIVQNKEGQVPGNVAKEFIIISNNTKRVIF